MRHLIDFGDLSREEWDTLYQRADQIISAPENFIDVCRGKVSCNLFYEPSTRTNFSFQTAMLRLGGSVFGFADPKLLLRGQGRNAEGHHQDGIRLCGCHCHAHPLGGSGQGRLPLLRRTRDQRWGRRPHAPHPDHGRPDHHHPLEGQRGRHVHRPVRGPEKWPHGPLAYQSPGQI